jgi:protein-disulfide isomerase
MKTKLVLLLAVSIALQCFNTAHAQQNGSSRKTGKKLSEKPAAKKAVAAPKKPSAEEEDCGCETKTPPDTLAIVNGVHIKIGEIDAAINDRVKELQDRIVAARKNELDVQINTILLEEEAKRRGIGLSRLMEVEIVAKAKEPTETEVYSLYNQNKTQINRQFSEVKGELLAYLRRQNQREVGTRFAGRLRSAARLKILVPGSTLKPPQTDSQRRRLLAVVNGHRITTGDIEDSLRPTIFNTQEEIYELRKTQLELKSNDVLLEQEAKKRNTTSAALLTSEVAAKVTPVTEPEAKQFYEENKHRVNASYEQVKDQILQYLTEERRRSAETLFSQELRKTASIQIFLSPPEPPVLEIAIDDQPIKGRSDGIVTIVEFTDFECPSCARAQPLLEEMVNEYPGKVKLVVRDFPLDQHTHAMKAAEAAEAAREQGKYWEYTAILFKNQAALEVEHLKEYASQLGLDRKSFDAALDSGKFRDQVQRDVQDGHKLGVNSTPTVFINGKKVRDKTRESFKLAIDEALKSQQSATR